MYLFLCALGEAPVQGYTPVFGEICDMPTIRSNNKSTWLLRLQERVQAQFIAVVLTVGLGWLGAGGACGDENGIRQTDHWSFQPLREVKPPENDDAWITNPIDAFVLERLRVANLRPSPPADRVRVIRRIYLDVHGVPPSPETIDSFLNDENPEAFRRLIDRLLASPRYGERWARHWLDVTRFAETHGNETNRPRLTAYHYRDYVISALNSDKPYDEFVFEQLVGDSLGLDAATGFLVGGAYDGVQSQDVKTQRLLRQDELADMVNTTGTAFLGLTIGCARCHDHKFDPLLQTDYYAVQAVFAGVRHGERALRPSPPTSLVNSWLHHIRERRVTIQDELDGLDVREPVNPRRNVEEFAPTVAKFVRFVILETTDSKEASLDEIEVFPSPTDTVPAQNLALASTGAKVKTSGDKATDDPRYQRRHLTDGEFGVDRCWVSSKRGETWVEIELATESRIERIVWSRDRKRGSPSRYPVRYRFEIATKRGEWREVANSSLFRRPLSAAEETRARRLLVEKQKLDDRERQLALDTVYAGNFEEPQPTHRLRRGDPESPLEVVAPGALSALPLLELDVSTPEQERRKALAQWIVREGTPLTARVMVNRIWHYHFGVGIVDTPSDVGNNGSRPTHPLLLDWLTHEFIDNGWSMKHIHRLILQSSTYRQSSLPNSRGLATDAHSRLLWRFPPRRLEAEAIRDSLLAVSGALNLAMGGPGFDLLRVDKTYGRWTYQPVETFGSDEWRRMVYGTNIRMKREAVFGVFDTPDAGQVCPKRNRSTTAIQALNLFNSPFVIEQAQRFAARVKAEAVDNVHSQVTRSFQLALGRDPDAVEAKSAVDLVGEHGLLTLCRALYNANEFLFLP